MYRAKDYRLKAWGSLKDKWGVIVITQLIYLAIIAACDGLTTIGIGAIALLLVGGPMEIGINKISLNVVRGETVEIVTLFDGFKDFVRSLILWVTNQIFIFLWTLLFVIPGIIKMYSYSMSYFILLDNPDMSANDARKKSMEMMKGNKWRLFCLDFSYIGWLLLSALTFGILSLWVAPSNRTARAFFYQSLLPPVEVNTDDLSAEGDVFDNDVNETNDSPIAIEDVIDGVDDNDKNDIVF